MRVCVCVRMCVARMNMVYAVRAGAVPDLA